MKNNKNKNISFESSLNKLEEIVKKLESGNVDLETSVELYEKGIELRKICEEKLKKIDLQIKTYRNSLTSANQIYTVQTLQQ